MDAERVKEIEDKIADLKGRWPRHSIKPSMWQELERLEDELKEALAVADSDKIKGENNANN